MIRMLKIFPVVPRSQLVSVISTSGITSGSVRKTGGFFPESVDRMAWLDEELEIERCTVAVVAQLQRAGMKMKKKSGSNAEEIWVHQDNKCRALRISRRLQYHEWVQWVLFIKQRPSLLPSDTVTLGNVSALKPENSNKRGWCTKLTISFAKF